MHISLSEVDAYSISVLGEENWVFLRHLLLGWMNCGLEVAVSLHA